MAKAKDDLLIIDKTYELVVWSCRHIARFPRSHRFTLGDRLEHRLYDVLEKLLYAKYNADRLSRLREVNMELEMLRFQFRIARDLGCLPVKSYGYATRSVNEIGQMLGGWIKQSAPAVGRTAKTPR